MDWNIAGADRATGENRQIVVSANDEAAARQIAAKAGMLVEHCITILPIPSHVQPVAASFNFSQNNYGGAVVYQRGSNASGIAAIVLGVFAVLISLLPVLGCVALPLAILGLFLSAIGGIVAATSGRHSFSTPTIGAILSLIALTIVILINGSLLAGGVAATNSAMNNMAHPATNPAMQP